jgi:HEAT repeat protein
MTDALLTASEDSRALAEIATLRAQGDAGVAPLIGMLTRHSWVVRRAIVDALTHCPASSTALLVNALELERGSEPIISGLVDALAASSAPVAPLVRELLDDARTAVVCDAIQILGRRRDRDSTPRLVQLTGHEDDNVALAAIEALGRIRGNAAVEQLLGIAQGSNFFRIFPAIDALGRCGDESALATLTKFLDKPLYVTEAARALGRLGSIQAVPSLLSAMTHGPEANVVVGATALVAIDERVGELGPTSAVRRSVREHAGSALRARVARAMGFADGREQVALGRLLVWLATSESISDLLNLIDDHEEDVANLALEGLAELAALDDPRLLASLANGTSELRARLLPRLGGVAAALPAILSCLHDPQPNVRALACHALSRGGNTGVVAELFALLADPDLGVVHAAVGAIQSLGSDETERLALAATSSANPAERRAALRIVTYLGYERSFALCEAAVAGEDERLRDIAISALPTLDDPRALPLLLGAAGHASARTRAAAVRALGNTVASAPVVDVLTAALDDPDPWARYYACQSLGKLGVRAALSRVEARLLDGAGQVRMAAVEALARIPGAEAASALTRLAAMPDPEIVRAAIVGIGERGDPSLRPIIAQALTSPDAAIRLVATSSLARFPGAEPELEQVVVADADPSVRRAAIELLSNNPSQVATDALVSLLGNEAHSDAALAGLCQHLEARVPALFARLRGANDAQARLLLHVLSRSDLVSTRRAIDEAFQLPNVAVRRAAAKILSLLLDDSAKSALARAASSDADPEVRRISATAIA